MTSHKTWLAASAVGALSVFVLMWIGYAQQWTWLAALDTSSLDAMNRYGTAHPGWVDTWNVFCTVLGPTAFRLFTMLVIVWALVRRNPRAALFLLISVELSGLITQIAKDAVDRPRPVGAFVSAHSTSFPSGHAVGVTVGVLALLTVAWPVLRPAVRPWLIAVGAVVVVAIGVGRVALNVHHPSDVLAGWALGYAYVMLCVVMLPGANFRAVDEIPAAPGSAR